MVTNALHRRSRRQTRPAGFLIGALLFGLAGCGYTTQSNLPEHIKTIYVEPIKNKIDLSSEIRDDERLRVYRPGLEVELTSEVINRFIFDGHLKVTDVPEKADAHFKADLIEFRRDPLRYEDNDDVQEYRLNIQITAEVIDRSDDSVLWRETITGDTTFFLSGIRAESEDEVIGEVIEDVARRVVERTVEFW